MATPSPNIGESESSLGKRVSFCLFHLFNAEILAPNYDNFALDENGLHALFEMVSSRRMHLLVIQVPSRFTC